MKKKNLYYYIEMNYITYLQTGVVSFKKKAQELYNDYKKMGGTRIIKELEVK